LNKLAEAARIVGGTVAAIATWMILLWLGTVWPPLALLWALLVAGAWLIWVLAG